MSSTSRICSRTGWPPTRRTRDGGDETSCDNPEARHGSAGARPSAGGLGAISGPPERRMSARRRRLAIAAVVVVVALGGVARPRLPLAPPPPAARGGPGGRAL